MMGFMGLGWLLWLVIAAAIIWLAWRGFSSRPISSDSGRAEEILKERYAKGEIDRETYQRMLGDVRAASGR